MNSGPDCKTSQQNIVAPPELEVGHLNKKTRPNEEFVGSAEGKTTAQKYAKPKD